MKTQQWFIFLWIYLTKHTCMYFLIPWHANGSVKSHIGPLKSVLVHFTCKYMTEAKLATSMHTWIYIYLGTKGSWLFPKHTVQLWTIAFLQYTMSVLMWLHILYLYQRIMVFINAGFKIFFAQILVHPQYKTHKNMNGSWFLFVRLFF